MDTEFISEKATELFSAIGRPRTGIFAVDDDEIWYVDIRSDGVIEIQRMEDALVFIQERRFKCIGVIILSRQPKRVIGFGSMLEFVDEIAIRRYPDEHKQG